MRYAHLRWVAVLVSAIASYAAGGSATDRLDAQLRRQLEADHVPGLAYAVVRGGRIVRGGAFGYANVEWKTPVSVHTKFEIASISKMFAGAAARILIEEGKLDPESPVGAYFHGIPESWEKMKVRHLVTMSSGLPEDFASELIPYDQDVTTPFDDASMVRAFFNLKMAAPVGARYVYSSPNYAMLGMIVANLSGKTFPEFVRERIFGPAGMTESSYIDNSAIVPERADGYRRTASGELRKGWYLGQYLHARPDDGVLTTATDLARWLIAVDGRRVVRAPDELWQPTTSDDGRPLDYAYGWIQDTWLGHRREEHSGGYRTGFHTFIERFPDDDLGVVVLTNCDFSPIRDYANLIARAFMPGVPDLVAAGVRDENPAETERSINALRTLAAGAVDTALMDPDAIEPIGIEETAAFLHAAKDFRFAGRWRVADSGLMMHGRRLLEYDTIGVTLGERTQFITLYRDGSGRIVYAEATN